MVQDLSKLDVTRLSAMTPEVISRQATMNIGTIGHVAHGKSTVVRSISGVKTVKFKSELVRNITIKLGYANAKLYRSAEPPYTYDSRGSDHPDTYIADDGKVMQLQRHISFVDCPGSSTNLCSLPYPIIVLPELTSSFRARHLYGNYVEWSRGYGRRTFACCG